MHSALAFYLALLVHLIRCQSLECPESRAPSQLAAVTVWTRESNGSLLYRISDEDLTDEGYRRGTADREDVVILLARSPGSCTLGPCTLQLSTNVRESDGVVSHQENVLGIPDGFKDIHNSFYCVRRYGDCGAQRPVFRYTKGSGSSMVYAYSLDPTALFPGYSREGRILCYGWDDSGSVVHALSMEKKCLPINTIANGKVTYSTGHSAIHSIGTTATLVCDEGYLGGGQSAVLCVKTGWYPASGLGYCVKRNDTLLNLGSARAVSSDSLECAALGSIQNGQLVYSTLAIGGRFPQGTHVTVLCNIGYDLFGSINAVCEGGRWSRKLAVCQSSFDPKCPSLNAPFPGRIAYSSLPPYTPSTTATLICDLGLAVSGEASVTCTEDGWSPKTGLGKCRTGTTGGSCSAVTVFGGMTTYIQANNAVPYSSGSTVFIMCNIGYTPQGSMSSLCQNGAWSPTPGSCLMSSPTGSNTVQQPGLNSGSSGGTCVAMTAPQNGYVTYSPSGSIGSYPSGTTATLSCNLGYTVSGTMSSMCSGGTWIPGVLGMCYQGLGGLGSGTSNSILECPNPTVVNGVVTYSMGTALDTTQPANTVATLTCNVGFTPTGSTTATCQNGVWTPTLGMCSSSFGGTGGIGGIGGVGGIGGIGGIGSTQQCQAMFPPFGGILSYSTGSTFGPFYSGTTVTLRCNNGGYPQGSSTSSCSNGQWNPPTLGTCSLDSGIGGTGGTGGLTCQAMFPPFGGTLSYSTGGTTGPFSSGTTVNLMCTSGYPTGSSTAYCTNGQWSPPTLGTCSSTGIGGIGGTGGTGGLTCSAMTTPLGATLTYSSGSFFGPFNSGTTVSMTCSNGSPLGSTTATCSNGQWYPPSLGTCNSMIGGGSGGIGGIGGTCPTLTAPPGGTITMSNGLMGTPATTGTIATLYCPSGVQGSTSVLCSNGMWTPPTLGTCLGNTGGIGGSGTTCQQAMTTPSGATLTYSNFGIMPPFPSGTTVTARCMSGALITGSSTATCINGQWQPYTLGTCGGSGSIGGIGGIGGTTCPNIQAVGGTIDYSDSDFSFSHQSGTTATLLCTSGVPLGSALSTCQNGQWVPTIGSCSTTGIGGIGGAGGTSCTVAPIPSLGATLSYSTGSMFGPWPSGTTATMTCPMGQSVIGTPTVTCNNGVWTALGQCLSTGGNASTTVTATSTSLPTSNSSLPCYFGLVDPPNGYLNYTDPTPPYASGSTATLTCDKGYTVTGPAVAICSNGSFGVIGSCRTS